MKPAHLVIREYLLEQIRNAPPNCRLPTEFKLAELFGVSRLTVHKAVTHLREDGLVVRNGKQGTFVSHDAHLILQNGVRKSNGRLLVVYPNWFSYDCWMKVEAAQRIALRYEMSIVPMIVNPETKFSEIAAIAKEQRATATLFVSHGRNASLTDIGLLNGMGHTCVMLFTPPVPLNLVPGNVHFVHPDYHALGVVQTKTLTECGHKKIAYMREEPWSMDSAEQLRGIRDGMETFGLPPSSVILPKGKTTAWTDTAKAGYERTFEVMHRKFKPTALIFDAITGAHAGVRALTEMELRVPDDISILLSAPEHPYARYDCPRLGSVFVPHGNLVDLAMRVISGEKTEKELAVTPDLMCRESVNCRHK